MFDKLPDDIIYTILFLINNIHDVINVSNINNNMYNILDDEFYTIWARHYYTNEFWDKAILRSPFLSNPLPNMRMELLRLNNFDNFNKQHGLQRWKNEDYYLYWETMEKNLSYKIYEFKSNRYTLFNNAQPKLIYN